MIPNKDSHVRESPAEPGDHEKVRTKNDHFSPTTVAGVGGPIPAHPTVGVPAAGASPEAPGIVVVLSPNTANPVVSITPSPEQETGTPPELRFQDTRDDTAEDERFCIQVWVLCGAVTFPIVFSLWLLLVPYMVRTAKTIYPGAGPGLTQPAYPSPSQVAPTFTLPTYPSPPLTTSTTQSSLGTTIDVWSGVPPGCLTPPVSRTLPVTFQIGPHYNSAVPAPSTRPFFCAYDNRFVVLNETRWNFMFETLPFALCPNVVYWSVGVVDGSLTSRLPGFDQQHGLQQLRNITDRLGFPNIRILLALGGYREDAPHFSRLGRDDATLQRLMQSVTDGLRNYRLNGVTVDWVLPAPGCAGTDDKRVLAVLLRRLRQSFADHGMNQTVVSLMVTPDVVDVLDNVADVVDYFFIGKHISAPPYPTLSPDFCSSVTNLVHAEVGRSVQSVPRVSLDQLCVLEDLTPIATDAVIAVSTGDRSLLRGLSAVPFYRVCNDQRFCRNDSIARSCVLHFVFTEPPGPPHRLAAFLAISNVTTLQARANLSAIRPPSISPTSAQGCMLAVNLHADNFAAECRPAFRQYLITEHVYYGAIGQSGPSPSILNAAQACTRY